MHIKLAKLAAIATAAAVTFVTAPTALADDAVAMAHAGKSTQISFADLDLATDKDVARLNGRIARAAERVCAVSGHTPLYIHAQARQCMADAIASSSEARTVAIAAAQSESLRMAQVNGSNAAGLK